MLDSNSRERGIQAQSEGDASNKGKEGSIVLMGESTRGTVTDSHNIICSR